MVFLSGLEDEKKKYYVWAAGIFAVIYGLTRVKFPKYRIFAEVSMLAGFGSLIIVLGGGYGWGFLLISTVSAIAGINLFLREFPDGKIRGAQPDPKMREIIGHMSKNEDGKNTLCLAALLAVMLKADETDVLDLCSGITGNTR